MTVSLAEIERLEYAAVDEMAQPSCGQQRLNALSDGLAKLRLLKAQYLAQHTNVLRKATGEGTYEAFAEALRRVRTEPAAADKPNAPSPDATLPAPGNRAFRAPPELSGQRIYTIGGSLDIPSHGIVHIAAPPDGHVEEKCDCVHCGMVRELKGRGFKEQRARKSAAATAQDEIKAIHREGRARMIAAELVGKQRGENAHGDILRWLAGRNGANNTRDPVDTRPHHQDGPGPGRTYATSAADFRRRFFGEN